MDYYTSSILDLGGGAQARRPGGDLKTMIISIEQMISGCTLSH